MQHLCIGFLQTDCDLVTPPCPLARFAKEVCRFFTRSHCQRGDRCPFVHPCSAGKSCGKQSCRLDHPLWTWNLRWFGFYCWIHYLFGPSLSHLKQIQVINWNILRTPERPVSWGSALPGMWQLRVSPELCRLASHLLPSTVEVGWAENLRPRWRMAGSWLLMKNDWKASMKHVSTFSFKPIRSKCRVKGQVRGLGVNLQSQLSSLAELWLTAHGLDMLDPRVKTNTAPEQPAEQSNHCPPKSILKNTCCTAILTDSSPPLVKRDEHHCRKLVWIPGSCNLQCLPCGVIGNLPQASQERE